MVHYEIKELAVSYESQRKGVGTRMLDLIEEYLSEKRNVEFISLQTAWLSPAYDFYIKNDYTMSEDNAFLAKRI